jgi:hypothetical protein
MDVGESLPVVIPHDEAPAVIFEVPGRREAAWGWHEDDKFRRGLQAAARPKGGRAKHPTERRLFPVRQKRRPEPVPLFFGHRLVTDDALPQFFFFEIGNC